MTHLHNKAIFERSLEVGCSMLGKLFVLFENEPE